MQKRTLSLALLASTLSLYAAPSTLAPITVTSALKTRQSLQNVTDNLSVITADEIKDRGYKTLTDALSSLPGITINRNGGLGQTSTIKLRGMDGKRLLVVVDGIRYNDPTSLSGAQFEHILIDNIARIEVIKGAQSGVWGADASAGVINIVTKKAADGFVAGSLFAEYGSFNTLNYGLSLSHKVNRFDIALNAQRITSDGFSAAVKDGKRASAFEDDAYKNSHGDIKAGFNFTDKDRVEAFYSIIDAKTDFDGYDASFQINPDDANTSATSRQYFYSARYKRTDEWGNATVYAQRSTFKRAYSYGNFDGNIDEFGANARIDYLKDAFVTVGVDHKKFKQQNSINHSYNNDAVFLTTSGTVHEDIGDTILSAAFRYDKFDAFDNKSTYKLGFKYTPKSVEDLWISANYGTGYNAPLLYNLYDSFSGNAALHPEKTKGYDVSINYKGLGVSYFNNRIDDMIDYQTTDFTTFAGSYFNVAGTSRLSGLEVAYEHNLEAIDTSVNLNYTYLKAKDKDDKTLLRRPKNSANVMLDYYGLDNTHLGTQIRYVGKRDDVGKTLDAYSVVDLSGDYAINASVSCYAKINNVLDKEYEDIAGYGTSERAFYAGIRYKLP